MSTGPSRPASIPLSGAQSQAGSVQVTEGSTNSGGGNSVNTVNGSVNVSRPFNGSAPSPGTPQGVLALTLQNALSLGLRANLGVLDQSAAVLQAKGQRRVALSQLLPNLNAAISEEAERLNLRTMGVETTMFPEAVTFNYFDARGARLQQAVIDFVKLNDLRSASENLISNLRLAHNARDLVVLAVAGTYVQLIATNARIEAADAEVQTARAIYSQASDRFALGLAARIDVTRSQVQLQTEEQRLRSLQADLETQKLRLSRIIGLPLGQPFTTADDYHFVPLLDLTEETALGRAFQDRHDLQGAAAGIRAAENAVKAARAERLPNLNVNADFGAAGLTPTHESTGVFTASATLTIPLFEGGRIKGDIEQAAAALRQRQAEFDDMRGQVDEDVRQAFIDLRLAADQVRVSESNRGLAHQTLEQSRDRFSVGVADTVELVQAEQGVVQADNDYISAVFEHNLAKVSLARAMGNAEQTIPQFLKKD